MSDGIDRLNALSRDEAERALANCCGASRWVAQLVDARPFSNEEALRSAAQSAFATLVETDWLEAFTHHPRIGDLKSLREKFASTAAWAAGEQSGASAANEEVLQALSSGNQTYAAKFGFIFIVCATGKSAPEMLALLQERLPHTRDEEIRIASGEQIKITELRITKLLTGA